MRWMIGVAVVALAACGGDTSTVDVTGETYTATLAPEAIVGTSVTSSGSGTATLTIDGGVLEYRIDVSGMDQVTEAHIHGPATPTANAPVRLTLFSPSQPTGPVSGVLVTGTAAAGSPALNGVTIDFIFDLIRTDSAFVMVHSVTYPDGEIRGHVTPE